MKILVPIKRVADYNVQVRPTADGSGVDLHGVKMSVNPFDENAIEEALRLREAGHAKEIVAMTIGSAQHQDVLRHALAMGVDRVLLVESAQPLGPIGVARSRTAVVEREQPELVLMGKQAIDEDAGQAPQMLAALLGWPQGTFVSKITVQGEAVEVVREIDGGTETLRLALPAVISADLRLNDPRFVKLPGLMQAKKKPIETLALAELGAESGLIIETLAVMDPPPRGPAEMLSSVDELVSRLKNEAGVL